MLQKSEIIDYLKSIKEKSAEDGILKIGLFGSYANGVADLHSDIDLAVKFDDKFLQTHDAWAYFDAINKLKSAVSKKFQIGCDIFDLSSSATIASHVAKEAIYV